MSVNWKTDHYGYDGDYVHGHIRVNYWQGIANVEAEIDEQFVEFRTAALADWFRLTGASEDGD